MLRRELRAGVCALFCINAFRKKLRSFAYLWASGRHKKSSNSRYGSASSRTPIQKERCFKDGTRLVDSAGLDATLAFTDGSSIGNPGPSGAGAYVAKRTERGTEEFFLSYPLHGAQH